MVFATAQQEGAEQQCIFCHIASGSVAAKKVYEDENVVAILDIHPANPGHVLLLTKEHFMVMPQMPDDLVGYVGMIAKAISKAMLRALKAEGTTVFIANGLVAGQRASHFMMHVIPRMEKDSVGMLIPAHAVKEEEFEKLRTLLAKGINAVLGRKEDEADQKEEIPAETTEKTVEEEKSIEKKQAVVKKKTAVKKGKKAEKGKTKEAVNLDDITKLLVEG